MMKQIKIKETLDKDLERIVFDDNLRNSIRKEAKLRKKYFRFSFRYVAAACLLVLVLGTTAAAGYFINNITKVNHTVLPELDSMEKIDMVFPDGIREENGLYFYDFTDINSFIKETHLHLLTTDLAQNSPYMLGSLETDKTNAAIIKVENFIIGDTSDFNYNADEKFYSYTPGTEYKTPISMEAIVILSDEQLAQGLDSEYLGYYEYYDSFVSSQGYKVNLIQSTTNYNNDASDIVSEKCAVFVANGIRYTLKGHVSIQTMKQIINSLYITS